MILLQKEKEMEDKVGVAKDLYKQETMEEVAEAPYKQEIIMEEKFLHLCKDATEAFALWN